MTPPGTELGSRLAAPAAGSQPAAGKPAVGKPPAGTAPLTFGQLAAWRDACRKPAGRRHESNVSHTFTLPRPVALAALTSALAELEAKHESLRTIYDLTDPRQPRQRLLPPAAPVPALAVPPAVDEQVEACTGRPFELERDRPFRVLAIADGAGAAELDPAITRIVLCLHHLACDGWSIGLLWTDLLALLAIEGQPLPPAPDTLYAIAREQRTSASWQKKQASCERHFRAVYQSRCTTFRHRDPAAPAVQAAVESSELASSAQALASAGKVSTATVFTAAFLDAVAGYCEPGPVRIGLMTSNRFLQRWQQLVTTMNQLVPIVAVADPAAPFTERLAPVQLAGMRAYRLGMFDVDQLSPAALGIAGDPELLAPICILNIVVGAQSQYPGPAPGTAPALHWERAVNQAPSGCGLRVDHTQQGTVRLRLRTGGLAADTCAGILLGTYQRVVQAVR